jgi:salicylate hydroxylase
VPTGPSFIERFKRPYVVIHRVDLHRSLLDACRANGNVELIASAGVTAFEDRSASVRVTAEDGRNFEGAAMIGADGLRSTIRNQMFGASEPRLIGYVAHRTIIPMSELTADVPRKAVVLWSGPGFHIVHYPLRGGTLFNIVAVFKTPTFAEKADTAAYRAELDRTYSNAHPAMKALIAMLDLERRWPISDRDPIRHWGSGRVTLLGDAAHPTLQTLAQGACMAIEDSVCIADEIALSDGDFASAFRQYQNTRYLRTARLQYESRYLWDNFYHLGGIEREVARYAWSGRSEADVFECLAWLYDGFALPQR